MEQLPIAQRLRWWTSDALNVTRQALPQLLPSRDRQARLGPGDLAAIQQCVAWLEDYIGKPHPDLGRNGDICPFVRTALRRQKMSFFVAGHVNAPHVALMKRIVLYEGWRMLRRIDPDDKFSELTTTNILFPNLTGQDRAAVDVVHGESKTSLMRRGVMTAAFYPGYDKPGIYNDNFQLYQSPFPIIVVRPMALHDIMFLSTNREAFVEYHRRFATRYHAGKVSDDFGYPARFRDAEQRFELV